MPKGEPSPKDEARPQPDGGPTYSNGQTTIWYDTEGQQHAEVIDKSGKSSK